MSFVENVNVKVQDSMSIDAFGRWRVSEPNTIFDAKFIYDSNPLIIDWYTSGSGSYTHVSADSDMKLTVVSGTDTVIAQSIEPCYYQPGKSQLYIQSVKIPGSNLVDKQIGYYDGTNGIFLSVSGTASTDISIGIMKNGVITEIFNKGSWNVDNFDGSGPSGVTLDLSNHNLFWMDMEWLGIGRVRSGFIIDGKFYIAHQFLHTNIFQEPYMKTGTLPVRAYIKSRGGSGEMDFGCLTVQSEGGSLLLGKQFSIPAHITGSQLTAGQYKPILAYRLKSGYKYARLIPKGINIAVTTTGNYIWTLEINPVLNGSDIATSATFTSIANTACEFKDSFTNVVTTSGYVVDSGVVNSVTGQIVTSLDQSKVNIGTRINGGRDVMVLSIKNISNQTETYYTSMSILELI